MITFIISTIILTALALAFVLIPLLRHQDSIQLNGASHSGRWAAPVLTIAVPLLAISVYLLTGNYQAIDRPSINLRALWFMGLAEFENTMYSQALEHWSQLQKQLPPQGKEAIALEKLMNETRQRIKLTPLVTN